MVVKPCIGITVDVSGGGPRAPFPRRLTLKNDYVIAVSMAGGVPVLIPPEGGQPTAYAKFIDGLLIPGGGDLLPSYYGEKSIAGLKTVAAERSDFEISLFREIIGLGKPVLGICYGMQLVNVALGGSLYQDIKNQVPGALDHRRGHYVTVKKDGPLGAGRYRVQSTHHQAVKVLGKGLRVIAASKDGLTEAFYMDDYPFLLCVQWHPERDYRAGGLSDIIFGRFIDAARNGGIS